MSVIQSDNSHPVALGVDDEGVPFGIRDPICILHIYVDV
jgi:hypothetical protein